MLGKLPWPSREQSAIFISSSSCLVFSASSILSAKTDPLVCIDLVFWKGLNKCFFLIFPQESLFREAGHSVESFAMVVELNYLVQNFKQLSTLDNNSPLKRCLKTVYRQSTCWQLKYNPFNMGTKSLMLPISIMWYLQSGGKHILSSWRAIQYSLLTKFFSYVFADRKTLFFAEFVYKLGIACNITAAIWIEKTNLENKILLLFVQSPPKKKEVPYMERSCDNDRKGKKSLIWKCHVTTTEKGNDLLMWKFYVTMTEKDAYKKKKIAAPKSFFNFHSQNKSLLSTSSIQSPSPIAYHTTVPFDKLTCTDYVDFANARTYLDKFHGPRVIPITWM